MQSQLFKKRQDITSKNVQMKLQISISTKHSKSIMKDLR